MVLVALKVRGYLVKVRVSVRNAVGGSSILNNDHCKNVLGESVDVQYFKQVD